MNEKKKKKNEVHYIYIYIAGWQKAGRVNDERYGWREAYS